MSNLDQLLHRLDRIYRQLEAATCSEVSSFPATIIADRKGVLMHQDFRGGMSDGDIREAINRLIFHIAHVKDLFKAWLKT